MGLETATYIDGLNPAWPLGTDDKGQGDNHLRLVKSAIKATFPNVTGAITASHTELNSVTNRVSKSGDTYTGTHNMTGATVTAATQTTGDNSTKVATTAFVAATALSATLPGQSGNAGKYLTTNGTTASWATVSVGGTSGYTDLNNAIDNGLWRLGTSITNGPVGMSVDNGQLIVSCNSDTAFQIVTDATNDRMAWRTATGIGGTPSWKAWKVVEARGPVIDLSSTSNTIDMDAGNAFYLSMSGNVTISLTNVRANAQIDRRVTLQVDCTSAGSITWSGATVLGSGLSALSASKSYFLSITAHPNSASKVLITQSAAHS